MDLTTLEIPEISSDIIFIVSGLALCLFGSLIFRFGTRLIGIGLGMGFGFFLGELTNTFLSTDQNLANFILLAFSAVGAIAALFVIKSITNLIFALLGFLFGLLLGRFSLELYASFQKIPFVLNQSNGVIIVVISAISAFLAVLFQRYIMIFIAAYIGSTFLVASIHYLTRYSFAFLLLLFFSILWQTYILKRLFRERRNYNLKSKD